MTDAPEITEDQQERFKAIAAAARLQKRLCLLSGFQGDQPVALLCIVTPDGNGDDVLVQPLARLLTDEEIDTLRSPDGRPTTTNEETTR